VTAGIFRAVAVALLGEILLVIGQPSANPVIFTGQVAASAFLAGILAAGVRHLRRRPEREAADGPASPNGSPS